MSGQISQYSIINIQPNSTTSPRQIFKHLNNKQIAKNMGWWLHAARGHAVW